MMSLLQELMQQGVVVPVLQQQEGLGFYSHIFLVKKPLVRFSLILNLKILIRSICYKKFHIDSIFSVRKLLTMLYGIHRPKGCIFAHSYLPVLSKVSLPVDQYGG